MQGPKLDTQPILAIIIVSAFIGITALYMLEPPSTTDAQNTTLQMLIAALGVLTTNVVNFYFGSSRGSADKDAKIAEIATSQLPPAPPSSPLGNGTPSKPVVVDATVHSEPAPAVAGAPDIRRFTP